MSQALQLSFQTNTDQARNAIAQLASTVASNMVTIGTAMKGAYDHQERFKSALSDIPGIAGRALGGLLALGAAVLVFHEISNAIEGAKEKLKELVDVGQGAKAAGVGTDFFQTWTSHAGELNTTVEKLAGTLQHAKEASEVHLGQVGGPNLSSFQGVLAGNLKVGNISQADVDAYNSAKTLEDKFKVVLDLVEKLNAQGKQLAALDISQGFFGTDFTNRLRQGTTAVTKMREDLAGITKTKWPPELIERATQLNEEIEKAKSALEIGLAPIQADIAKGQLNWLVYTRDWYNLLVRVEGTLTNLYNWVKDIYNKFDEMSGLAVFSEFKRLQEYYDKAEKVIAHAGAEVGYRLGLRGLPGEDQSDAYQLDKADQEAGERTLTVHGAGGKDDPSKGYAGGKAAGAAKDETTALETYMDQLQKSVAVLEAETRTFGQSNTAKARDVDLTKAQDAARRDAEDGKRKNKELTDEETKAVLAQADAEGKAKDRTEQLQRAQAAANEQAQLLGNSLISAFDKIGEKGTRATDIIKDMVKSLIRAVEQATILGTGPFANLFGTQGVGGAPGGLAGLAVRGIGGAFGGGGGMSLAAGELGTAGPGFAEAAAASVLDGGGWAGSGPRMMVPAAVFRNARQFLSGGGIPSILHPGEIVLNAAQQKNVAGNMGMGQINLTHAPVINGTGLSAEQVFSVVQRSQKEFARQIGPIFNDWQMRHG